VIHEPEAFDEHISFPADLGEERREGAPEGGSPSSETHEPEEALDEHLSFPADLQEERLGRAPQGRSPSSETGPSQTVGPISRFALETK